MFMDVKIHYDYAEIVYFKLYNKIQSEHYGSNRMLSK